MRGRNATFWGFMEKIGYHAEHPQYQNIFEEQSMIINCFFQTD